MIKNEKTYETIESRKRKQTNTEIYSVKYLFRQLKKKPKILQNMRQKSAAFTD